MGKAGMETTLLNGVDLNSFPSWSPPYKKKCWGPGDHVGNENQQVWGSFFHDKILNESFLYLQILWSLARLRGESGSFIQVAIIFDCY